MPFEAVAQALANVIGTDITIAGFILGFVVVVVLVIAFGWVLGDTMSGNLWMGAGIAVIFVTLVGWWPLWAGIFIGLIIALVIVNPFGSRSGGV